jgi:hypothetical protein
LLLLSATDRFQSPSGDASRHHCKHKRTQRHGGIEEGEADAFSELARDPGDQDAADYGSGRHQSRRTTTRTCAADEPEAHADHDRKKFLHQAAFRK